MIEQIRHVLNEVFYPNISYNTFSHLHIYANFLNIHPFQDKLYDSLRTKLHKDEYKGILNPYKMDEENALYCYHHFIILDEMNREQSERNTFDIVYNFVNLLENVARSTKHNIKVIMIGNTLDEASDILSAFNFIPDTFGRYKLRNKRCVIDYIMPSEAYKKRREGTLADLLMPEASCDP